MSPAPRPWSQPSTTRGSYGGKVHMSSGPVGTTSTWPFKMSERPSVCLGWWMPTTLMAFS